MSRRCAVIGTGQTHHAAARRDVSLGGLVREAASRAIEDARLDWPDIEAIVLGKAPDILEGVMSPELYLADALAGAGKPILRAYTSGNAGGMAASMGVNLVASGLHSRVLVVAFEKQSEAKAAGATLQHVPFEARWQGGTGSLFGALCSEYVHRAGRAFAHRGPGRTEGPAERPAQPVRPGPPGRHQPGDDRFVEDALGPHTAAAFVAIL